jgi:hypothetical protein
MTELSDDAVWAPFGQERWRELADGTGASELQLKFAAARFSGASASAAARIAGYAGDAAALRRAGYAALRSTAVQNLLELAAINAPADAKISDKEIEAKIAKLIRSADSNVSLKAMEQRLTRLFGLSTLPRGEQRRNSLGCLFDSTAITLTYRHVIRSFSAYTYGARQTATQPRTPQKTIR